MLFKIQGEKWRLNRNYLIENRTCIGKWGKEYDSKNTVEMGMSRAETQETTLHSLNLAWGFMLGKIRDDTD